MLRPCRPLLQSLLCLGVREARPDAALGDTAPHMFQMEVRRDGGCFLVDGRRYKRGFASGRANFRIDSLRQMLGLVTNVDWVQSQLQLEISEPGPSQVTAANFLTLDLRWAKVVDLLLGNSERAVRRDAVRIVCVDTEFLGNGDVLGTGELSLFIARENGNRFCAPDSNV